MRNGLHVLGITLGSILTLMGFVWAYSQATTAALTDDARLAIEISCADAKGLDGSECQRLLSKLYLAGALEPDTTLRSYCESVKTGRWQGSQSTPPRICVERFGGW